MPNYESLHGRVVKVRRIGRKLAFLEVSIDGELMDCLLSTGEDLDVGDYLVARGNLQPKPAEAQTKAGETQREFFIRHIDVLKKPVGKSEWLMHAMTDRQIEAMRVRTMVNRRLHEFYLGRNFLPVHSPAIVGNWAESKTGAFPVRFYQEDAYLTVSRMIHHQMIQSLGYGKIFEIGQIFRTSDRTSRNKLAEFTNIIIGVTNGTQGDLMTSFSEMIKDLHLGLKNAGLKHLKFPGTIGFEHITYSDLLAAAGVDAISGHQLPLPVRRYLNSRVSSFVWVTGFPEHTRPFFMRSSEGVCDDVQLWFKGHNFLAAGGMRETNVEELIRKIKTEGKKPERYAFYLDAVRMGLPPVANIDLGIERFLANVFDDCTPADFTFFPRYEGRLVP